MTLPVFVLPILKPDWAAETIGSLDREIVERRLIVVDNSTDGLDVESRSRVWRIMRTGENLGCSASWNVGRRAALELGVSLVVVSEAVVFLDGGKMIDETARRLYPKAAIRAFQAWHLVTLGVELLDEVGEFDVGFWPIYFEDTDYEYRIRLAGREMIVDPSLNDSYSDKGHARSWREGWVSVDYERQSAYYRAKWGGNDGFERFVVPFGVDPR